MSERGVWVIRGGELIPKHLAPPLHARHGSGPMVISDGMADTWNPVTGRHYDSKRAYYDAVRQAGCEIVGNETIKPAPKPEMPSPEADVAREWNRMKMTAPRAARKKGKSRGI